MHGAKTAEDLFLREGILLIGQGLILLQQPGDACGDLGFIPLGFRLDAQGVAGLGILYGSKPQHTLRSAQSIRRTRRDLRSHYNVPCRRRSNLLLLLAKQDVQLSDLFRCAGCCIQHIRIR